MNFLSRVRTTLLAQPRVPAVTPRRMAGGQKQLKERIVAVSNVKKITKAMQMIASSKMKGAERRMHHARLFSKDTLSIWPEAPAPEGEPLTLVTGRTLLVPITSDRGLCGSLNTSVTRMVKKELEAATKANKDVGAMVVGEKGRSHLERQFYPVFNYTVTDVGKSKPITFSEASLIADYLLALKFDVARVFYNRFVNSLTYTLTTASFSSFDKLMENTDAWSSYEIEGNGDEVLENLYEFRTAVALFYFISENGCSEMSSRVNSMSNSSKNASELIENLLLVYNRNRQQSVTTELLEVISGALSVDEQTKQSE